MVKKVFLKKRVKIIKFISPVGCKFKKSGKILYNNGKKFVRILSIPFITVYRRGKRVIIVIAIAAGMKFGLVSQKDFVQSNFNRGVKSSEQIELVMGNPYLKDALELSGGDNKGFPTHRKTGPGAKARQAAKAQGAKARAQATNSGPAGAPSTLGTDYRGGFLQGLFPSPSKIFCDVIPENPSCSAQQDPNQPDLGSQPTGPIRKAPTVKPQQARGPSAVRKPTVVPVNNGSHDKVQLPTRDSKKWGSKWLTQQEKEDRPGGNWKRQVSAIEEAKEVLEQPDEVIEATDVRARGKDQPVEVFVKERKNSDGQTEKHAVVVGKKSGNAKLSSPLTDKEYKHLKKTHQLDLDDIRRDTQTHVMNQKGIEEAEAITQALDNNEFGSDATIRRPYSRKESNADFILEIPGKENKPVDICTVRPNPGREQTITTQVQQAIGHMKADMVAN